MQMPPAALQILSSLLVHTLIAPSSLLVAMGWRTNWGEVVLPEVLTSLLSFSLQLVGREAAH